MISNSFFSVLWTDPLFYTSGGRDPYSSIFIENDSKKLSRRSAWLIICNVFDKCHVSTGNRLHVLVQCATGCSAI